MNKEIETTTRWQDPTIEMLYNKLDAQDKIINEQALEIARLKGKSEILEENNKLLIQQKQQMYEDLDMLSERIDKAIDYIKDHDSREDKHLCLFISGCSR